MSFQCLEPKSNEFQQLKYFTDCNFQVISAVGITPKPMKGKS